MAIGRGRIYTHSIDEDAIHRAKIDEDERISRFDKPYFGVATTDVEPLTI